MPGLLNSGVDHTLEGWLSNSSSSTGTRGAAASGVLTDDSIFLTNETPLIPELPVDATRDHTSFAAYARAVS